MSALYNVASSPHVRSKLSTNRIMLFVIISLLPTTVFGVVNFGLWSLLLIVLTIAAAVASEWIFNKITKRPQTIGDFSAVLTGLLLALNFPGTMKEWWIPLVGGAFAIIVVKMLFGGLGQNFMNPALGARCFLLLSFTGQMSAFTTDVYTSATPLALIKTTGSLDGVYSILDLFIGKTPGTIGETSAICLLIGAVFLLVTKIIDWRIPLAYIGVFVIIILLFGGHLRTGDLGVFLLAEILGGGLIMGAFFMATDYVTSPITPRGRLIYGALGGLLIGIFRLFGPMAEGCSYSIIFANMLVPIIERYTIPKPFGKGGEK